ncbi:MAG TPA: response regulator [Verrucomicrobiae bacterium]
MKDPKNQVLLLDDNIELLEALAEMFGALSQGAWRIHTAATPDAAADLLKSGVIKLLVVDINMPQVDGIQFAEQMRRRQPLLKIAVMSGEASEVRRAAAMAAGADLFIEKSYSPEGMKAIFGMLGELVNWSPQEGFPSALRSVGLQDVIQMECVGRNSSVLEISNDEIMGRIYVEEGQIVHAAAGELTGEKALQKLLDLPGSAYELAPFEAPQNRTITAAWESLLAANLPLSATSTSRTTPAAAPLAAPANAEWRVVETLVCTGTGATLYEEGCDQAEARMHWLLAVAQQASIFKQTCPLGNFDRLELHFPASRVVAQARDDRMVYVRAVADTKGGAA